MSSAPEVEKDDRTNDDLRGSVEKGSVDDVAVVAVADDPYLDTTGRDHVQRKLLQRHIQMIAIAGTMGTGLFLGSGRALSGAGPAGSLLAYALVGTVAYSSLCSVGEMTSLAPVSGTFPHFAARWVDPALGFAVGWNYLYGGAISVPVEITAAQILLTFWDSDVNHTAIYTAVIIVTMCAVNLFGVKYFGEVTLITGLILVGLIIDLGGGPNHDRLGFRYWRNPGAFAGAGLVSNTNTDRFLGWLSVIVQAAFSFQGMEVVAIAASETKSPRRNIAKAVRRVFYRILVFYILGILITGMLVPYDDPALLQTTGNAAESPYVIAITRAGIKTLPSIINAAVFTSAFSAGNSTIFSASRILYGLAVRGQAPRIFMWCTKKGLPLVALLTVCAFSLLSFMNVSSGSETVFTWLVNLSTVGGFFGWMSINLTYLFFYRGLKAQGIDRKKLIYFSSLQPYLSCWGLFWTVVWILINGFEVFFRDEWNVSNFLTAYINIPIFFGLFAFWKIYKKTKVWKPHQMDFVTGIPTVEETEEPIQPPTTLGEKIAAFLF